MDSFLKNFPNYIFCYIRPNPDFDPSKDDEKKATITKHNLSYDECLEYNTLRWKWDIYFTPNWDFKKNVFKAWFDTPLSQRRNTWRSANNAENIYAFVIDIDWTKDEIWKNYEWLDKPTYVIETKKWHHIYYILKKPLLYKDYKKEFTTIEERLVVLMKWDPKCTDSSRILRVPWFKYRKDNKWEYEITIKEHNDIEYDYLDIYNFTEKYYVSWWKDNEEKKVLTKKIKDPKIKISFDEFFDEVQRIDVVDVLYDLFGSTYDVKSSWAIYENGKRTDWYKYCKRWNYLNTFSANDRPTWWPYSVAKFYYRNTWDVVEYFKQRWNIELKKFEEFSKIFERKIEEIKKVNPEKKWRRSVGDDRSWITIDYDREKIYQYWDFWKEESEYVNWVLECYWVYTKEDKKRYIIKIKKNWQEEIKTLPIVWGASDLRKFLMSCWLIIWESKAWLITLLKYLTSETKEYAYVDKLWLQIVNWKKVVIKKWWTYLDEDNLLFIDIPEVTGDFIEVDEKNKKSIKDFIEHLIKWYAGEISVPTFLVMCIGVNVWFWRNKKLQTPQYFLSWLSQTWKSTMVKSILKTWLWLNLELAAASKVFTYQKMAKHYMPVHFSEYRNASADQVAVEGFLRDLFDWTPITKWQSDQSIVFYETNAVYVLDWQTTFTDDAAMTRLFYLIANPKNKWDELMLLSIPNVLNKVLDIFKDTKDFDKYVSVCLNWKKKLKSKITLTRDNDRMIQNFSYLFWLLEWLWLSEYDEYLYTAFVRQNNYIAVDDIKSSYQTAFNLQQMYKFSSYIYRWWMVIEIIPEYLRSWNISDFKGMIKTVNHHFLWEQNPFIGMEIYVDVEYIYKNRDLWNAFLRTIRRTQLEWEYWPEEYKTIWSIKEFVWTNFKGHEMVQELNFAFNSYQQKNEKDF